MRVAPRPIDGIDDASTSYDSVHGRIVVAWRRDGATVHLEVTVPPGVVAEVRLGEVDAEIGAGVHRLSAEFAPTVAV